ncbi:MAG: SDR family NAD(P)-dependent oxidoreductase [Caldilineaceae bacterium]
MADLRKHDERQQLNNLVFANGWGNPEGVITADSAFWVAPADALIKLAAAGFFPTTAWFRQAAETSAFAFSAYTAFAARPYLIRHPQISDLAMLLHLEEECWSEPLRATEAELRNRLAQYPQGHYLLVMQGQVAGVIYSQRILAVDALYQTNFRAVAALHRADGPIAQPLAVNVLPAMQQYGLGDQLLEFLLQLATLQPAIEQVAAVTLCKNYGQHNDIPLEAYIHLCNEHGQRLDPILNFHVSHGARICGLIDGYRPADVDNQGKGVLVQYDLRNRLKALQATAQLQTAQPDRSKPLPLIIEEAVRRVLGQERAAAFSPNRPLMEMGFTSFHLLELRTLLSQQVGVALEPTFFFRYSTPQAMMDYFQSGQEIAQSTTPQRAAHHYTLDMLSENDDAQAGALQPTRNAHSMHTNEPIAIIGMACRFPGGVTNPDKFWSLLVDGVDAITEVPQSRWRIDDYYGDEPGQMRTRYGGFLDQVDGFDAPFFRIAPVEAMAMDPQQRLLLETHWEALEYAGINPLTLKGSATGIYVGIFSDDYKLLQAKHTGELSTYFGTGTSNSIAAGRIAYFLGAQGPAMAVDTACSSSLVAVHLACQSLQRGESALALASGVNLLLSPELSITFSQANMLAPDGRCKTFAAAADGYVRSEGCGVVVLKRLADAQRDGDNILAVIRGTAINQDGASNGLTAPNGLAQEAVIRSALDAAQLPPAAISYVEAHGTGTPLGDPIEVQALEAIYGVNRQPAQPLIVGSVKTNIGHTEAAAGIAGLLKVVLALQHGYIPPHLHFQTINPHLAASSILVPTAGRPWLQDDSTAGAEPRRAAISSFGFSGTNAHVIVEEAPTSALVEKRLWRPYHLLTLSAQTGAALQELAQTVATALPTFTDEMLPDLAHTTNHDRAHFDQRLAFVAASIEEACTKLADYANDQSGTTVYTGNRAEAPARAKLAFLFTGQGSQYLHMGRELYETQPLFRRRLEQCNAVLQACLGRSLLELLYPETAPNHNDLMESHPCGQAANFAIECALADLWRSWGIEPDVVLGHSLGDFAAAYTAGVLSLEDGLRLVTERGRLMELAQGSMVSVLAAEAEVAPLVAEFADVTIGVINGPQSVVISGGHISVAQVVVQLQAAGFKTRKLAIPVAAHSPMLDPVLDAFEAAVRKVTLAKPRGLVVSSMTGKLVTDELTDPLYWRKHLRNTVRFADGVQTLHAQGCTVFLEVGPKPTLLGLAQPTLEAINDAQAQPILLPTLREGHSDWQQMLESLGRLYTLGQTIHWQEVNRAYAQRKVVLPTYPFQRQRYWLDRSTISDLQPRVLAPLLDRQMNLPSLGQTVFETAFSIERFPWLRDHLVYGQCVVPGAAHLAMVLNSVPLTANAAACVLEDVLFPSALILPAATAVRTVQLHCSTVATPSSKDGAASATEAATAFQLLSFDHTRKAETPVTHATGRIQINGQLAISSPGPASTASSSPLATLQARCATPLDVQALYGAAADQQLCFGPSFRWIAALWQGEHERLSRLARPTTVKSLAGYVVHPGLLDACLQTAILTPEAQTRLPFAVAKLQIYKAATGHAWWCHARQTAANRWDLQLLDAEGQLVAAIEGFEARLATPAAVQAQEAWHNWLYTVNWIPLPAPTAGVTLAAGTPWLIFADNAENPTVSVATALAAQLDRQGQTPVLVYPGAAYQAIGPHHYQLRPDSYADLQRLLTQFPQIHGVVHLWSLDIGNPSDDAQALVNDTGYACGSALHLIQALLHRHTDLPTLWLVTREAQAVLAADAVNGVAQSPLWGLGKVLTLEHPELPCIRVDLDGNGAPVEQAADLYKVLAQAEHTEDQLALRAGMRYAARLHHDQALATPADEAYQLVIPTRGSPENLQLQPAVRRPPAAHEVEICVYATGLNFIDVLDTLNLLPFTRSNHELGGECAGEIVAVGQAVEAYKVGDRVFATTMSAFRRYVTVDSALVAPLPPAFSFTDGATLPINFLTAYYALKTVANLKRGAKVLIHAAAGGTGMAAVQIAQWLGAEVYATASPGKWAALQAMGVQKLYNSRTLDFAPQILTDTGGDGVDVVLNSLTGEGFIQASLSTVTVGGSFVELAKRDVWGEAEIQMRRPDVAYQLVDLRSIILQQPTMIAQMLKPLLTQFEVGTLKPLPHTTFPLARVVDAFRYMQQARHIGKIVVTQPRPVALHADATYLITGGLGGLGLLTARYLIEQGARRLILLGRSQPSRALQVQLDELAARGATLAVVQADVTQRDELATVLAQVDPAFPLRGIVHAAGVLDDGALLQQTWPRFASVLAPKVLGAWRLHQLTLDQALDFFVMYSSTASLLGHRGQANHAAANAFLDALAHHRQAQGLPAQSINWGYWATVGAAAKLVETSQQQLLAQGRGTISPEEGCAILGALLPRSAPQIGVSPLDWSRFLRHHSGAQAFYQNFVNQATPPEPTAVPAAPLDFHAQWQKTPTKDQMALLVRHLRQTTAAVLRLPNPEAIDLQTGLMTLGMDSLMAVELRNRLAASLATALPASLLFDYPTLEKLATYLRQEVLPQASVKDAAPGLSGRNGDHKSLAAALMTEVQALDTATLDAAIEAELAELELALGGA